MTHNNATPVLAFFVLSCACCSASFAQEFAIEARKNDLKACVDSKLEEERGKKDTKAKSIIAACQDHYDALVAELPANAAAEIKKIIKDEISEKLEDKN